jgi:hypothetical protein
MSTLYDSGLYGADDLAEAYTDGYNEAKQTLTLTITTVCPICMEPLVFTKHPLRSLPLILHSDVRWCVKCKTEVPANQLHACPWTLQGASLVGSLRQDRQIIDRVY